MLSIEVIYATKTKQEIISIKVDEPCDVNKAIKQSGILTNFPEIDLAVNKVGIFSRICQLNELLHDFDRIEIYRPLIIDPKEARKQRANKNKPSKRKD